MATITLGGTKTQTLGSLPEPGSQAPDAELVRSDMSRVQLRDFRGKKVLMNIFPSVNTGVCAQSVRQFNEEAAELPDTMVLCISRDLPFAQDQFCAAEGIENVWMLSDYRDGKFGETYQLTITEGAFEALHSRVVIALNADGVVIHTEQVPEIGNEPNYKAALEALADA